MSEAKIARTLEETKEFGKVSRIILPDESRIIVSKLGWTLVAPEKHFEENLRKAKEWKKIELQIPFSEINLALKETIDLGYVENDNKIRTKIYARKDLYKYLPIESVPTIIITGQPTFWQRLQLLFGNYVEVESVFGNYEEVKK